jgi:hypothetical protein
MQLIIWVDKILPWEAQQGIKVLELTTIQALLSFRVSNLFFISQFICNLYTYIKYNQQIVCWEARAGRGVLCSTSPW